MALKCAVVGMGGIGNTHATCYKENPLAELVAVCDLVKEKADEAIGSLSEEKESLENEVEMLRASARDYRDRFLNLLRDQQHVLKAEKELFD